MLPTTKGDAVRDLLGVVMTVQLEAQLAIGRAEVVIADKAALDCLLPLRGGQKLA